MSPKSSSRAIHVYSDGTPETTRVVNFDGVEIPGVRNMTIVGEAGDPFVRITLEVIAPKLDMDGSLDGALLICPFCQERENHQCRTP